MVPLFLSPHDVNQIRRPGKALAQRLHHVPLTAMLVKTKSFYWPGLPRQLCHYRDCQSFLLSSKNMDALFDCQASMSRDTKPPHAVNMPALEFSVEYCYGILDKACASVNQIITSLGKFSIPCYSIQAQACAIRTAIRNGTMQYYPDLSCVSEIEPSFWASVLQCCPDRTSLDKIKVYFWKAANGSSRYYPAHRHIHKLQTSFWKFPHRLYPPMINIRETQTASWLVRLTHHSHWTRVHELQIAAGKWILEN
jgi:hypothetical protein